MGEAVGEFILIGVWLTAAVTFALTIFAFQTKIEITNCGGKSLIIRFSNLMLCSVSDTYKDLIIVFV